MNNLILMIVLSGTFFSCEYKMEKKTFYEDKEKVEGEFLNGERDGLFTFYYPNGSIRKIENYKSNKLNGKSIIYYPDGSIEFIQEFKNNFPKMQLGFNTCGDTILVLKNKIFKMYSYDRMPLYFVTPNEKAIIKFDTMGKLIEYKGPLYFLTNRDTICLDESYPDWKEQIHQFSK